MEFTEAESNLSDLISEYLQVFERRAHAISIFARASFSIKK